MAFENFTFSKITFSKITFSKIFFWSIKKFFIVLYNIKTLFLKNLKLNFKQTLFYGF